MTENGKSVGGAILAVDIGGIHTRAILLDRVEGKYRFVSRAQTLSTAAAPQNDIGVGLRRVLEKMTLQTGRYFVTERGEIIVGAREALSGVDLLVATASGGRPIKVVLVGLMNDMSLQAGKRALASIYADLVDTLTLNDPRSTQEQINAILLNEPDLIFIVGGTDDGAYRPMVELLNTVRLAAMLAPEPRPSVLFAGNAGLKNVVRGMVGAETTLYIADNVYPAPGKEALEPAEIELSLIYGQFRSQGTGGYEELLRLSSIGVLPTARSSDIMAQYIGAEANVAIIDMGSGALTCSVCLQKQTNTAIRPDLGMGLSAAAGLASIGADKVKRWLPASATNIDIQDYALNKTLKPATTPHSPRDLEFEYALAREFTRAALAALRPEFGEVWPSEALPVSRLIGAGSVLAAGGNHGLSAMLLLDSAQPVGVVRLQLDAFGAVAGLGAIANVDPLAAVQALDNGALVDLGMAFCPSGRPFGTATAMNVTVVYSDGRKLNKTVPAKSLRIIPLAAGQKAKITVKCGRGLRINGKSRISLEVMGGVCGLIFDGRGRSVLPPRDASGRAAALRKWITAMQGDTPPTTDPAEGKAETETANAAVAAEAPAMAAKASKK
jgi:MutL protein